MTSIKFNRIGMKTIEGLFLPISHRATVYPKVDLTLYAEPMCIPIDSVSHVSKMRKKEDTESDQPIEWITCITLLPSTMFVVVKGPSYEELCAMLRNR